MPQDNIRFEHIKLKDLEAFARRVIDTAKPDQFVPISLQRAVALPHNPFADPEDVSLLVAFDGDEIVGYFGIMAVKFKHGQEIHKAQWFTTWLVSPHLRGKRIGSRLLEEALSLKQDYLIVGSKLARRVCRKYGFHQFGPLKYAVLDLDVGARYNPLTLLLRALRKSLHLVGVQIPYEKLNRPVARLSNKLLSPLTRPLLHRLLLGFARRSLANITTKEVNQVRTEPAFTSPPQAGFVRGPQVVNWMLKYPWVVEPGRSPTQNLDYNFSDVYQTYRSFALEIYSKDDRAYQGVVVFTLMEHGGQMTLKILDYDLPPEKVNELVLPLAIRIAAKNQVTQLEGPLELTANFKRQKPGLARLLLSTKERIYQASPRSENTPLGKAWPELELNYCDGDTPFT